MLFYMFLWRFPEKVFYVVVPAFHIYYLLCLQRQKHLVTVLCLECPLLTSSEMYLLQIEVLLFQKYYNAGPNIGWIGTIMHLIKNQNPVILCIKYFHKHEINWLFCQKSYSVKCWKSMISSLFTLSLIKNKHLVHLKLLNHGVKECGWFHM